jgi:hypothetical protein
MTTGLLVTAFGIDSERMALALVNSVRRWNEDVGITVLGLDYLCGLDWRGMASTRAVRAAGTRGSDERWFNKLAALLESPFDETLYLDSDLVVLEDIRSWFSYLRTDDFTFFNVRLDPKVVPDRMLYNVVNPHRMKEIYGVPSSPVIESGGHFFFRRTKRGEQLIHRIASIMEQALDTGANSIYRMIAGADNIPASDEIAASMMVVEERVSLPHPISGTHRPIGIFMPPYQHDETFDFDAGKASYIDEWQGGRVTAGAVHFCAHGKHHSAYLQWIDRTLQGRRNPLQTLPILLEPKI